MAIDSHVDAVRVDEKAVEEGEDAEDRGDDEHVGVEAEPRVVHGDLDAEVVLDLVQGLPPEHVAEAGPVLVEHPPRAVLGVDSSLRLKFRWFFFIV